MTIAIVHDTDHDGVFSAAYLGGALTKSYRLNKDEPIEDIIYIRGNRPQIITDEIFEQLKTCNFVYYLDFEPNMKDAEYFEQLGKRGIFTCVLDHHVWAPEVVTALEKNNYVSYAHCPLLERNMKHLLMERGLPSDRLVSTAELVSHLVIWNKAVPSETRLLQQFIRHVSDYDTFSFREIETKYFHHAITPATGYTYQAASIPDIIEYMQKFDFVEYLRLIEHGSVLEEEFNNEICKKIAEVQLCTDSRLPQQQLAIVRVEERAFVSLLAKAYLESPEAKTKIIILHTNEADGVRFSVRSSRDSQHSARDYAQLYGGGGHIPAAGFMLSYEDAATYMRLLTTNGDVW